MFGDLLQGGHTKAFYDVAESPNGADLQHVLQDGFVVVLYDPRLPEEERSALSDWALRSFNVVVAPAAPSQRAATVAHTTHRTLACARASVDALEGFRTDWLTSPRT